nr:hypothetical protein [Tanacetum cinerariifolium]
MSLTEAKEEEAARCVHATHERLVMKYDKLSGEPANRPTDRRRPSEQLVADTMQALKASRKISRIQSHNGGSNEGDSITPEVLDELTGISKSPKKQDDQDDDNDRSIDIEEIEDDDDDEKIDDEFVHVDEYVHHDVDENMKDVKYDETRKDNEEITDVEKTEATKGDYEQAGKLPLTSSSLFLSSGFELKQIDHSSKILATISSQVPSAVNEYLGLSIGDSLQKKDILFKMMLASKSYEKHQAHKALYDAHIKSLLVDEDDMDQAVVAMGESALLKRKHDDQDEDPTAGSNKGKDKKRPRKDTQASKKSSASKSSSKGNTPPKAFKSGKHVYVEEPEEAHVHVMSLDVEENIVDEMGNADEQPDGKFAKKHLKLDKITKADLVRPVYSLLKGTCQSSIELEYNMEECYKALTDKLD